jgi:hypothetical protein
MAGGQQNQATLFKNNQRGRLNTVGNGNPIVVANTSSQAPRATPGDDNAETPTLLIDKQINNSKQEAKETQLDSLKALKQGVGLAVVGAALFASGLSFPSPATPPLLLVGGAMAIAGIILCMLIVPLMHIFNEQKSQSENTFIEIKPK